MKKIDASQMKKVLGGFDNSVFNAVLPRDMWMNPDGSLMFPPEADLIPVSGSMPVQESVPIGSTDRPLSATASKSSNKGK